MVAPITTSVDEPLPPRIRRVDVVFLRKKNGAVFSVAPPSAKLTVFVAGNNKFVAAV